MTYTDLPSRLRRYKFGDFTATGLMDSRAIAGRRELRRLAVFRIERRGLSATIRSAGTTWDLHVPAGRRGDLFDATVEGDAAGEWRGNVESYINYFNQIITITQPPPRCNYR